MPAVGGPTVGPMARRPSAKTQAAPPPPAADALPTLDDVLGHAGAVDFLRRTLAAARVPQAWMFTGPPGVGKRTLAEAFARALLTPSDGGSAGDEARSLLDAGTHPDLVLVSRELASYSGDARMRDRKQRTIPLDLLREFFDPAIARTASLGGGQASKVAIIDEAHLLASEGQNHLLKTLEEPPPRTVIILVADRPHDLLPTIHSRCQRLTLRPLDAEAMDAWLARAGVGDERDRALLRDAADGAPGMARLMHQSGATGWGERLGPLLDAAADARDGGELADACVELASDWAQSWVKAHPAASKESANRTAHGLVLRVVAAWGRRRLWSGVDGPEAIEALADCHDLLERDVHPRFAYETLAGRLALATPAR